MFPGMTVGHHEWTGLDPETRDALQSLGYAE